MNFCGSLCTLLEHYRENTPHPPHITHANPMTMPTSAHIYSKPDYCKTKENVNMKVLDLCEFDCLHFTQYMQMSQHGIDYKQT